MEKGFLFRLALRQFALTKARAADHFYFQAPGGQVFRLVGSDEGMTK